MAIQLPIQAHAYIDAQWDVHLERTRTFLCQPSISAQNMGVREAADLFRQWLEERNAHVEYHGRETHPIIYAEWDVGKPKTLLVYGMYDVQPVDNQAWTTPPFDAKISPYRVRQRRPAARPRPRETQARGCSQAPSALSPCEWDYANRLA